MSSLGIIKFVIRQINQVQQGGFMELVRKLVKFLRLTLRIPIGGLVVSICYLIKPLITIRFGHLYTSRIGHLCVNMDNYIYARRERGGSRELGVFRTDKRISNTAIFTMWSKHKGILFSNFAEFPLYFLEKYIPNSTMQISFNLEMGPIFSLASISPKNLKISVTDEQKIDKLLQEQNINSPYICLHNRDSAYLNFYGSDGNFHDYRDFDFDDFKLGINQLADSGLMSVRVGEKVKHESRIVNEKFISITGSDRSDFSDVALITKCLFFVGSNTGFSNISRVLRKPELLINYTPLEIGRLSIYSCDSLILPKKIYKLDEQRYLSFSEIMSLSYNIHYQGDFFSDMGLLLENNSQTEISEAIMEMWARVAGNWQDSEAQSQLQNQFWKSVDNVKYSNLVHHQLNINICSTFLERNSFMI